MKSEEKYMGLPESFHENLIIPKKWRILPVKKAAGEFIYALIKKNKLKSTLESGLGLGVSAAYIISATRSKHIAIDPFYKTEWDSSIAMANMKKLGFNDLLIYYKDYSYNILPQLAKKGLKLDFAFIDGDHKYDSIFIDYFYMDLMLQKGGFILFDDAWMRTTQLVASFIRTNKHNYKEISTPYKQFILFQKIKMEDTRPWYYFREFHNKKAMKTQSGFEKYGDKIWDKNWLKKMRKK
jgi:predicted O-methyltransferase YrrM